MSSRTNWLAGVGILRGHLNDLLSPAVHHILRSDERLLRCGTAGFTGGGPTLENSIAALPTALVTRDVETLCGILVYLVPQRSDGDAKQARRHCSIAVSTSKGL